MEYDLNKLRKLNELDHLVMCPRCADAIPVFIRKVQSVDKFTGLTVRQEVHCIKCYVYGHKDGTYIGELCNVHSL